MTLAQSTHFATANREQLGSNPARGIVLCTHKFIIVRVKKHLAGIEPQALDSNLITRPPWPSRRNMNGVLIIYKHKFVRLNLRLLF